MVPFLKRVKQLRQLSGSTALAFDLVVTLGEYSWSSEAGCGEEADERPSDEMVDDLLVQLAPERRRIEPDWNFRDVLASLSGQAKNMAGFGISGYCRDSIETLKK